MNSPNFKTQTKIPKKTFHDQVFFLYQNAVQTKFLNHKKKLIDLFEARTFLFSYDKLNLNLSKKLSSHTIRSYVFFSFCVKCNTIFSGMIGSGKILFLSNYNKRCILPLPIIPPSFSSLHSLEAEKRLPEVRRGFVYFGHETGSGGFKGSGVPNLSFP